MWDSLGKSRTRATITRCPTATKFKLRAVLAQPTLDKTIPGGNNRQTEAINSNSSTKTATHLTIMTKSLMKTPKPSTPTQATILYNHSLINRDKV